MTDDLRAKAWEVSHRSGMHWGCTDTNTSGCRILALLDERDALRRALMQIAHSQETDLAEFSRFAGTVATEALAESNP